MPPRTTGDGVRALVLGVADGLSYGAIGRRMDPLDPPSHNAVKLRVYRLMRKWGALDRANLVHLAYLRGVLTVDTPRDNVGGLRVGDEGRPMPKSLARPPGHTTTREVSARG